MKESIRIKLNWFPEFESHLSRLIGHSKVSNIDALSKMYQDRLSLRLMMSDGMKLVLKWFNSEEAAETHYNVLSTLKDSDFPNPAPIGFVSFEEYPGSAILMEHLPGERWSDIAGDFEIDKAKIDALVSLMIQLESLECEVLNWRQVLPDFWTKTFARDAEEYDVRIQEISLPPITVAANEILRSLSFESWTQIPDHGDLGPHNLLFENVALTGVVDWDRAVIQDRSIVVGTVVAEVLTLEIPIESRRVLVKRLLKRYATEIGVSFIECQLRALPMALTRTLDWLCYQKGAPAQVHVTSLEELVLWSRIRY